MRNLKFSLLKTQEIACIMVIGGEPYENHMDFGGLSKTDDSQ